MGLPAGATLTPSNIYGQADINWTPTVADIGRYTVLVKVANNGNGNPALIATDSRHSRWWSAPSNQAPCGCRPATQRCPKGQALSRDQLQAIDPDGDPITYSATNLPPVAQSSIRRPAA